MTQFVPTGQGGLPTVASACNKANAMMTASEAFAVAGVRLEGKKHFKYGLLVEKIDGGAAFTADGLFFQLWVHRAKGWPHWEAVEPNVGVDKLKLAPGDWVAFVHTARPRS